MALYCHNGTGGQRQVEGSLAGQLGKMANSVSMLDLSQANEAEVNRGRQPGLALASMCTEHIQVHEAHTLNALALTASNTLQSVKTELKSIVSFALSDSQDKNNPLTD